MTVGMIEDVITVHLNYLNKINQATSKDFKESNVHVRDATQADFDRFAVS